MISSAHNLPVTFNLPHFVPPQFYFPQATHPTDQEIANCAYLIWEQEGRPDGQEKMHWEQARAQLIACREHDQWLNSWCSLLNIALPN